MIPSILHNNLKYSCYNCELGKIDYFLRYFNILEKKPKKLNQRIIKRINSQQEFEIIKKAEVFNPLFKAIHDDNIEELRKISNGNNFNINCSILNSMETINNWSFDFKDKIQLIKLAAFSKSVKVFKYLIMNHAEIDDDLINYAIAGGNTEIIRICQQQECPISLQSFEYAIKYYQNDILLWLIEQNCEIFKNHIGDIFYQSIFYSNPQALLIILDNDNFCLNQDNFCFFEDEWISFLFTTQFFEEKIRKAIENADFGYLAKHNIHAFEKYLKNKGELEQYKNKTLFPPYPNELILKVVIENNYFCKNISVAGFSQEFIVFLFENHFFHFYNKQNKELSLESVFYRACIERIKKGDINLLYEIERSNPIIIQKVYNDVFQNKWIDIMINYSSMREFSHDIKKHFMERCLIDNELNFDIQTEGFCYSCFYGKNDLVCDFLNRKYIDVNSKKYLTKNTPLILAIRCGYTSIVQLLINDKRIDVNLYCDEKHQTPFYYACEDNYIDLVELLLKDERVDINIPNIEGKTAFLVACEKGYYRIVKRLLQRKDLIKGSPFNLAVTNWQHKTVKLLIESGLNINNENDKNPLQIACLSGDLKMVELLFSTDLKKDIVDDEGRTLLHLAYINRKQDIIDFLIEKGFDKEVKDKSGLIPVQYSQLTGIFKHEKNPVINESMVILTFEKIKEYSRLKGLVKHINFLKYTISSLQIYGIQFNDIKDLFVNSKDYIINHSPLFHKKKIGSIFLGENKINNQSVVIKILNEHKNDFIQPFKLFAKEMLLLKKINHPAIKKYIGIASVQIKEEIYIEPIIIMHEYLPVKTLKFQLEFGNWNSTKKYISLLGIAHAMKCLHRQGITHLNLRPENILLDDNLYPEISGYMYQQDPISGYDENSIYIAPEIEQKNIFSQSADVFSFAMIAYYIITSKNPYFEFFRNIYDHYRNNYRNYNVFVYYHNKYYRIMDNIRYNKNDIANDIMRELISLCANPEYEKRPPFDLIFYYLSNFDVWHSYDLNKYEINNYIQRLKNTELAFE